MHSVSPTAMFLALLPWNETTWMDPVMSAREQNVFFHLFLALKLKVTVIMGLCDVMAPKAELSELVINNPLRQRLKQNNWCQQILDSFGFSANLLLQFTHQSFTTISTLFRLRWFENTINHILYFLLWEANSSDYLNWCNFCHNIDALTYVHHSMQSLKLSTLRKADLTVLTVF